MTYLDNTNLKKEKDPNANPWSTPQGPITNLETWLMTYKRNVVHVKGI